MVLLQDGTSVVPMLILDGMELIVAGHFICLANHTKKDNSTIVKMSAFLSNAREPFTKLKYFRPRDDIPLQLKERMYCAMHAQFYRGTSL